MTNDPIYRPLPRPSARSRLLCFHHAGGSPSVFRTWPKYFPEDLEIGAIRMPGHIGSGVAEGWTDFAEAVPAICDAISSALDRPYAIFGHSLGALLAFEAARELRRRGASAPSALIVASAAAPQARRARTAVSQLPNDGFLAEVSRRYGGIPEEILSDPEARALFVPILRADLKLFESYVYRPEPPFEFPILAFGGRDDTSLTPVGLEEWGMQTHSRFAAEIFEGGHFFFHSSPIALLSRLLVLKG